MNISINNNIAKKRKNKLQTWICLLACTRLGIEFNRSKSQLILLQFFNIHSKSQNTISFRAKNNHNSKSDAHATKLFLCVSFCIFFLVCCLSASWRFVWSVPPDQLIDNWILTGVSKLQLAKITVSLSCDPNKYVYRGKNASSENES